VSTVSTGTSSRYPRLNEPIQCCFRDSWLTGTCLSELVGSFIRTDVFGVKPVEINASLTAKTSLVFQLLNSHSLYTSLILLSVSQPHFSQKSFQISCFYSMAPRALSIVLPNGDSSPILKTLPSMVLQQESGWKMQKSHSDLAFPRPSSRSRGYSESRMRDFASSSNHPFNRITPTKTTVQPQILEPAATVVPSSSLGNRSSLRDRSPSVSRVTELGKVDNLAASSSGNPGFWWSLNRREVAARPWNNTGEADIPEEQKENWEQTRKVTFLLAYCFEFVRYNLTPIDRPLAKLFVASLVRQLFWRIEHFLQACLFWSSFLYLV